MNPIELLALKQAIYKAVANDVKTKEPDNLRGKIDEYYRNVYEQTGGKSFNVNLDGEKVGTYTLKFSKPRESQTIQCFVVDDYIELAEWYDKLPDEEIRMYCARNLGEIAEFYWAEYGEIPDGCQLEYIDTEPVPEQLISGDLRIDPKAVEKVMGERLGPAVAGLLGDGE